jgi:hypothetical protein
MHLSACVDASIAVCGCVQALSAAVDGYRAVGTPWLVSGADASGLVPPPRDAATSARVGVLAAFGLVRAYVLEHLLLTEAELRHVYMGKAKAPARPLAAAVALARLRPVTAPVPGGAESLRNGDSAGATAVVGDTTMRDSSAAGEASAAATAPPTLDRITRASIGTPQRVYECFMQTLLRLQVLAMARPAAHTARRKGAKERQLPVRCAVSRHVLLYVLQFSTPVQLVVLVS